MVGRRKVAVASLLVLLVCHHAHGEAGPGEEEEGQRPIDSAYMEHVQSIFSAIMEDDGQAGVQGNDLRPQEVDVHTILPRIPALKLGMNAMGHKMLHVHSDETGANDRWSSEILSSGLTAGFALTDRVKGMQKGDGQAGSQWLMYSKDKAFRVKDEGSGDVVVVKDGSMTLQGTKGDAAGKPRLTIVGGESSVPRVTLVSKTGGASSFVSLYNRFGKFGVFSGPSDQSVFHITADGAEMALVSPNAQPHILIQSTSKSDSIQEVRLRGADQQINLFHKAGSFGICATETTAGAKCQSFFQASGNGQNFDLASHTESVNVKISHSVKGGTANLELVSPDKLGTLTSTTISNKEGTFAMRSQIGGAAKDTFEVSKDGYGTFHGGLNVQQKSTFHGDIEVKGDILVSGVVTMSGGTGGDKKPVMKPVSDVFEQVEHLQRENKKLRSTQEDMMQDLTDMRNELTNSRTEFDTMKSQMQSMLKTMQMMREMQLEMSRAH